MNDQLELALKVATEAHKGQTDKQGLPYILHPLHLMDTVMPDMAAAVVALLHDVIEDSELTIGDLHNYNFSVDICRAVHLLTRSEEDSYDVYIRKISGNELARKVKLADLRHNSDITRLKGITEKDIARMVKYHRAYTILMEADNK